MTADLGNRNWFRDIQCFEGAAEAPLGEAQVQAILTDHERFPSPVRPMGSRHSMTACMAAQVPGSAGRWGTAVDMSGFTGDIQVDQSAMTVRVPAGLTFFKAAHQLRRHGLQFRVNTELGTLTMGAAACGATKDSSFPEEPGQVCHDVVGMRLVKPNGQVEELREGDPDFDALRCSYGLFGIVTELTFRVVPHQNISIRHEELEIGDFEQRRQKWMDDGFAVFLYLFPYARPPRIIAELRGKTASEPTSDVCLRLKARNFFWGEGLHRVADLAQQLPLGLLAPLFRDVSQKFIREFLKEVDIRSVSPVNQIVDFDEASALLGGRDRFTFSMWAFPTHPAGGKPFAQVLDEYFSFCNSPQAQGFRTLLPHVSYHISQDQSSLLSYSHGSDVWTLDPIASGKERGWEPFLDAFNDRCCNDWGGVPLFNQTPHLTRQHVTRAFGERLAQFEKARQRFDPEARMLNQYFKTLLQA